MSKTTKQLTVTLPIFAVNILDEVADRLDVPVDIQVKTIVLHYIKSNKAVIKYDGGRSFLFDAMEMDDDNQSV